jgi:hypothetical protein
MTTHSANQYRRLNSIFGVYCLGTLSEELLRCQQRWLVVLGGHLSYFVYKTVQQGGLTPGGTSEARSRSVVFKIIPLCTLNFKIFRRQRTWCLQEQQCSQIGILGKSKTKLGTFWLAPSVSRASIWWLSCKSLRWGYFEAE